MMATEYSRDDTTTVTATSTEEAIPKEESEVLSRIDTELDTNPR